jgi:DNA-binding NarL/FixJ family response regulator
MDRLRVLVAEDHPKMRAMLVAFLSAEFQVVGAVGNGEQLVQSAVFFRPDVIVSDVALPLKHGFAARKELLAQGIESAFVFVTMFGVEGFPSDIEESPVGFVHKTDIPDDLKPAIQSVVAGNPYLSRTFREAPAGQ